MWGKAKIVVKLREQGFNVSEATVGRIIAHLVRRGAIQPVPTIRKAAKTRKWSAQTPLRRASAETPESLPSPARSCNSTPSTSPSHPANTSSTSPPTIRSPNGPSPRPTSAPPPPRPRCSSTSSLPTCPSRSRPSRSTAARSSWPSSRPPAAEREPSSSIVLPPKSPEINGAVERCNSSWRYEFYAVYDLPCPARSDLNPLIDAFQHRYNTYRPHGALGGKTPAQYLTSPPSQARPPSLICPERGQLIDAALNLLQRHARAGGHPRQLA